MHGLEGIDFAEVGQGGLSRGGIDFADVGQQGLSRGHELTSTLMDP